MTTRIYTDRSRIETRGKCPRRRWLEYHEAGTGIQPSRKNIHLAVGGAVHAGLASLLIQAQHILNTSPDTISTIWSFKGAVEDEAVRAALADFSQFAGHLEGDDLPAAAAPANFNGQLAAQAAELGLDPSAFTGPSLDERRSKAEAYLFAELSALVEALVRAYARRRLRPLLEEFEVLEVEREGEWLLQSVSHDWQYDEDGEHEYCRVCDMAKVQYVLTQDNGVCYELRFLSRPDALLRHRQTNELQLLSFKTTGSWDLRKARDVQHDMQGLSEGVEIERRYCDWWSAVHLASELVNDKTEFYNPKEHDPTLEIPDNVQRYLAPLSAPPRVSAIRYEFLLKGERWKDKDLSAQLGVEARVQKSHLIYQYVATSTPKTGKNTESFRVGDVCWSWEFTRVEDQQGSKLYAGNWRPRAVWESGSGAVRDWIDQLDRSELCMSGEDSTVGLEPRAIGFKSAAQAMGVTAEHPLDCVFVPPVTVYRQEDQLLDWVEQVAEQESVTARHVAEVLAARDAGEKRSLLNRWFPQTRSACEYPTICPFARDRISVCWGGAEMQADPLTVGGGEYVRRKPNHPQERIVDADSGLSKL